MDKPSPDAINKQVEELSGLVDLVAEIWHGRNWVRRLLLLDILLFADVLQAIAETYARIGKKEKDAQLLSQALSVAEKISNEDSKASVLQAIAEAYAKLGDFRLARASTSKIPSRAGEAKTLALILEIWAKSKDPRLADEVSKDEE